MTAEAFPPAPERLHGAVIIEWPQPDPQHDWHGELNSALVTVYDAGTGVKIPVRNVEVTARTGSVVTAELTVTAEAGGPVPAGTFRVQVAGMRVREA